MQPVDFLDDGDVPRAGKHCPIRWYSFSHGTLQETLRAYPGKPASRQPKPTCDSIRNDGWIVSIEPRVDPRSIDAGTDC
jgi:hypothetical protein